MKRVVLLLIGFFSMPLGFLLNHIMMNVSFNLPLLLISIAMLAIWFLISMVSVKFIFTKKETILLLNAPAFLVLILNLFQEYVLGHYWMNLAGVATQFFYLPFLGLGFTLTSGLSSQIANFVYTATLAYIVVFVCLILDTFLGCSVAERRAKEQK